MTDQEIRLHVLQLAIAMWEKHGGSIKDTLSTMNDFVGSAATYNADKMFPPKADAESVTCSPW
jgi:hypothetical protein